MNFVLSRRAALLAPAAGLLATAPAARAQPGPEPFPTRPIRFVVPFAPGGPIDLIGRPLAQHLAAPLGVPVVVENRAGANGIVGAGAVARERPDGYTFLLATGSFTANAALNAHLPFDPERDFRPVTQVAGAVGMVLLARATLPTRSAAELVALARARPGQLTYAMAGVGNITHVAAELFRQEAGIDLLPVPFNGTSANLTELIAGNVDMTFAALSAALPLLQDSRVRALAYTAPARAAAMPDVPTVVELGYPGAEVTGWYGLWAPANTPEDRVTRVQQAVAEALKAAPMQRLLNDSGLLPIASLPADFARFLARDFALQRSLVERLNLPVQ